MKNSRVNILLGIHGVKQTKQLEHASDSRRFGIFFVLHKSFYLSVRMKTATFVSCISLRVYASNIISTTRSMCRNGKNKSTQLDLEIEATKSNKMASRLVLIRINGKFTHQQVELILSTLIKV